ncbi:MAG: CBS domain-containing protein, partial [Anaerolineales bacterium]
LYTATLGDSIRKVVSVMHQHGISQMPVVGKDGSLAGLLEEVDLLNHMLEKHEHSQDEPIDSLVQKAGAVFPPETPLEDAMTSLKSGYALIVVENSRPVGILTKIDVLDYVAGKI